jgi:hypothetical protein
MFLPALSCVRIDSPRMAKQTKQTIVLYVFCFVCVSCRCEQNDKTHTEETALKQTQRNTHDKTTRKTQNCVVLLCRIELRWLPSPFSSWSPASAGSGTARISTFLIPRRRHVFWRCRHVLRKLHLPFLSGTRAPSAGVCFSTW